MPSNYWIKLYHEILHDPKMGRLPDHLWRRAIELFLLAGETENDGQLPGVDDMAWTLRTTPDALNVDLCQLAEVHIVTANEDGSWYVTKFVERQAAIPGAERQARYRERQRKVAYYGDKPSQPDSDEPVTNRYADTDTEVITTRVNQVGAIPDDASASAAEPPPMPEPQPAKVKRTDRRSDPRSRSAAIQCARTANGGRYPPIELYDKIIATLGDRPDAPRLIECRQAWVARGYNGNAWTWLLEWYPDGIPKGGGRSNGNGHKQQAHWESVDVAAIIASNELRRGDDEG